MELVIDKDALAAAIALPCRMAVKKSPVPIFAHVRLTSDGGLTVDGTDAYRTARSTAEAKRGEAGALCVSGAQLLGAVGRLPAGEVRFRTVESGKQVMGVEVRAGAAKLRLPAMSADEWPAIATEPEKWKPVPGATVTAALAARYAVSTDFTRDHMFGMQLEIGAGRVRGVGVDGHRLAIHDIAGPKGAVAHVFIPAPSIGDVLALVDGVESVEWGTLNNRVYWRAGSTVFSYVLPGSAFPPYEKIIPAERNLVRVNRGRLLAALDIASMVKQARGGTKEEKDKCSDGLLFSVKEGQLRISAQDPEQGEAEDVVDVDSAHTTAEPIGISAHYMKQAVMSQSDEEIDLDLADPLDAVVVRGTGRIGVVMPMRV